MRTQAKREPTSVTNAYLHQFFAALDRLSGSLGFGDASLDLDDLTCVALKRARRQGFRDPSFNEALRLLLDCYEREARLNVFGRLAARWDVLRCLSNLLRFEEEEEVHPGILRESISKPIFITGLPRSGTTFLHTLLCEDSANLIPRCWQTIFPYPQRREKSDLRRQRVAKQLSFFQRVAPKMESLHPLSADSPQECTEITAQVFQSLRYEMTHRVPTYQRWIDATGHLAAYKFHKRFLQHLQHQLGPGQWILKCPDHVHALNAIEAVYPDCRFVFVHRDPLRVIASAVKLTEVVRRPFTRSIDKHELGRQVVNRTLEGAEAMTARTKSGARDHTFHVYFKDLAHDPIRVIEALYQRFGLEWTRETQNRMSAFAAAGGRGGANHYSFEEFGLDPFALSIQFQTYMNHFDVHRESSVWKNPDLQRAPIAA